MTAALHDSDGDNSGSIEIGLALSGGSARSVCHVGVLRALLENDIQIRQVAGTSGGGIVASSLAAGIPIDRLESIANDVTWGKLAHIRLSRWGLASSRGVEKVVESIIGEVEFHELPIPCAVVATDFVSGERRVFTTGPVARAVRASCALPMFFLPFEIDGHYYVDGGLSEYLPVDAVRGIGADFVVAVNLGSADDNIEAPGNPLRVASQFINIMARRNMRESLPKADFVIAPDLAEFDQFNFKDSERVIECGYQTGLAQIALLKEAYQRHAEEERRRRRSERRFDRRLRAWLRNLY